jgi:hypothetical protein
MPTLTKRLQMESLKTLPVCDFALSEPIQVAPYYSVICYVLLRKYALLLLLNKLMYVLSLQNYGFRQHNPEQAGR